MDNVKRQLKKVPPAVNPASGKRPVFRRAIRQPDQTHSRWVYSLPGRKDADRIRIGLAARWILVSQDTLVRATNNGWLPCRVNQRAAWRYFTLKDLYECYFLSFAGAARFFGVRATYLRKLCRYYIRWYSAQHRQQGIRYTYRISLFMACRVLNRQIHKTQIRLRPVPNNMEEHNALRVLKAMNHSRPKPPVGPAVKGA